MAQFVLEAYKERFKALVLQHMEALPPGEWERLRALSCGPAVVKERPDLEATKAEVIAKSLLESNLGPEDILFGSYKDLVEHIGQIEQIQVYYVRGEGLYFCGCDGYTMEITITWPAYPPNW